MNTNKWIIYTVSGVFALSLFFCVLSLAYTTLEGVSAKSLDDKIATCKKELTQLSKEEAGLKEWKEIKSYFAKFNKDYLMNMEDFGKFNDNLAMMFNKYGLSYKRIQHKFKNVFRDYIRVDVTFTVTGLYPGLKRFIHELINLEKMVLIRRIQLTKNKDRGDVSGKFALEVYLVR